MFNNSSHCFDSNCSIFILAAGKGTRMQSKKPKVLHEICGIPMIQYIIDKSKKISNSPIIILIKDQEPNLEAYLQKQNTAHNNIHNAPQNIILYQKERLGTGHAVQTIFKNLEEQNLAVTDIINENIIIIYGDTPFIKEETIKAMLNDLTEQNVCNILGFTTSHTNNYGYLKIHKATNYVESIIEYNEDNYDEIVKNSSTPIYNSGIIAIKRDILHKYVNLLKNDNKKKEYYLTDIIKLIHQDNYNILYKQTDETEVLGINTKQELINTQKIYQQQLISNAIAKGVNFIDPNNAYIGYNVTFASDITIDNYVYIGNNVTIDENVHIKSFSHIDGTKGHIHIKKNSIIGPYARIRENSNIDNNVKIGNFVEIKNSNIGNYSKINHLSYIGDTNMGNEVNIGAGTITCNFDGNNKYTTTIKDNCFIGSNTVFIAPITVESYTLIGAGSVINKNTNINDLAVARSSQKNLANKGNKNNITKPPKPKQKIM